MTLHSKFYLKRADARNTGHRRLCRRVPHPQDSRLSAASPSRATAFTPTHKIPDGDFSTQITYHAAERIKWSAFSATKMAQLCRVIFSKQ